MFGIFRLIDWDYLKTQTCLVQTVLILADIIVIICTAEGATAITGLGMIYFTCCSALLNTFVSIVVNLLRILDGFSLLKVAGWQMVVCGVFSICYFVSGCLAGAGSFYLRGHIGLAHGAYAASAIFCFLAMLIHGAAAYFFFVKWRKAKNMGQDISNSVHEAVHHPQTSLPTNAVTPQDSNDSDAKY